MQNFLHSFKTRTPSSFTTVTSIDTQQPSLAVPFSHSSGSVSTSSCLAICTPDRDSTSRLADNLPGGPSKHLRCLTLSYQPTRTYTLLTQSFLHIFKTRTSSTFTTVTSIDTQQPSLAVPFSHSSGSVSTSSCLAICTPDRDSTSRLADNLPGGPSKHLRCLTLSYQPTRTYTLLTQSFLHIFKTRTSSTFTTVTSIVTQQPSLAVPFSHSSGSVSTSSCLAICTPDRDSTSRLADNLPGGPSKHLRCLTLSYQPTRTYTLLTQSFLHIFKTRTSSTFTTVASFVTQQPSLAVPFPTAEGSVSTMATDIALSSCLSHRA